jgi:AcrR family transcriptional regulator
LTLAREKTITENDLSTEEKIKAAAKKLFTQKGFAATRTRDIAEEAGINLALLNYYFRSKNRLFELVMWENLSLFMGVMLENIKDNPRSFEDQLDFVVDKYIDMLLENPDLPFFVLNLLQSGHFEGGNIDVERHWRIKELIFRYYPKRHGGGEDQKNAPAPCYCQYDGPDHISFYCQFFADDKGR